VRGPDAVVAGVGELAGSACRSMGRDSGRSAIVLRVDHTVNCAVTCPRVLPARRIDQRIGHGRKLPRRPEPRPPAGGRSADGCGRSRNPMPPGPCRRSERHACACNVSNDRSELWFLHRTTWRRLIVHCVLACHFGGNANPVTGRAITLSSGFRVGRPWSADGRSAPTTDPMGGVPGFPQVHSRAFGTGRHPSTSGSQRRWAHDDERPQPLRWRTSPFNGVDYAGQTAQTPRAARGPDTDPNAAEDVSATAT